MFYSQNLSVSCVLGLVSLTLHFTSPSPYMSSMSSSYILAACHSHLIYSPRRVMYEGCLVLLEDSADCADSIDCADSSD